jgi:hypothetical protein
VGIVEYRIRIGISSKEQGIWKSENEESLKFQIFHLRISKFLVPCSIFNNTTQKISPPVETGGLNDNGSD